MKTLALLALLGIVPVTVLGQVASETSAIAPWLSGATVLALAGIFYKFMREQMNRLQSENDRLQARLESIADDDRKTIVPVLVRATEVLSQFADGRHGE